MAVPKIVVRKLTKLLPRTRPWAEMLSHPFRRDWLTVLDGVDLEIADGEVLGLLGPNGAGKSTLLKILCTQLLPTQGSATIADQDILEQPERVRKTLGHCFDSERSFYFRLTGRENLEFFAALNNLEAAPAAARIAEVLEMVGLTSQAGKPFMYYSKGMKQKLALARALLTDPSVLLLDEPTQNLDPAASTEFRRLVRSVLVGQLRKTIILVTHSLEEAYECCDRCAIMDRGRLLFLGSCAETQEYIRAHGFPSALAGADS
jgi:ABC-2 type transport system ATP-binding protein